MASFFSKLKEKFSSSEAMDESEDEETGYVELGPDSDKGDQKVTLRPYSIEEFEQIKPILDALREGKTIALINIKPLKDKDLIELKRAINKLKKTCDAVEGDIAGFGDDWIAVTPSFVKIHRKKEPNRQEPGISEVTEYSDDEKASYGE